MIVLCLKILIRRLQDFLRFYKILFVFLDIFEIEKIKFACCKPFYVEKLYRFVLTKKQLK